MNCKATVKTMDKIPQKNASCRKSFCYLLKTSSTTESIFAILFLICYWRRFEKIAKKTFYMMYFFAGFYPLFSLLLYSSSIT